MKIKVTKLGEGWYRAGGTIRNVFSVNDCREILRAVGERGEFVTLDMPDRMAEELALVFTSAGCQVDYV